MYIGSLSGLGNRCGARRGCGGHGGVRIGLGERGGARIRRGGQGGHRRGRSRGLTSTSRVCYLTRMRIVIQKKLGKRRNLCH